MSLKDKYKETRDRLLGMPSVANRNIDLDEKINDYMRWYRKAFCSDISERYENMEHFIKKVALWYELRYSDDDIEMMMHDNNGMTASSNQALFHDNKYVTELFDEEDALDDLNWSDLYSTKVFLKSLPDSEKQYFLKPKYKSLVWYGLMYFKVSNTGNIQCVHFVGPVDKRFSGHNFVGMHLKEFLSCVEDEMDCTDYVYADKIKDQISDYDNLVKRKEGMLDAVMYTILRSGNPDYAAYRALLFAKEFGRNIEIPMRYAANGGASDFHVGKVIDKYLSFGGSDDIFCYKEISTQKGNQHEEIPFTELCDMVGYSAQDSDSTQKRYYYQS